MFGTLGGPELLAIFVIALIVFGPRKLPEIGKSIGKMMAEFRKASNDFKQTIEGEVEAEKLRDAVQIDPYQPSLPYPSSGEAAPGPEPVAIEATRPATVAPPAAGTTGSDAEASAGAPEDGPSDHTHA